MPGVAPLTSSLHDELPISGLPTAMAPNVGFQLARLGAEVAERFVGALEPLGIRPRHYAVLSLIDETDEELSQRTVGGCLAIDKSAMVTVIDELEAGDLVRRQRSESDRRRNVLELTAHGRRTLADARAVADESERELLRTLDADQGAALRAALEQLLAAVIGR